VLDNKFIRNQNKIADIFNKYFVSVADSVISDNNRYSSANTTNPVNYLLHFFSRPFTNMNWQYTTTHEIDRIIKSLKTKNSSGYDEISSRRIKSSAPFIISPLTHICNAVRE
jgi:hypothetical protein